MVVDQVKPTFVLNSSTKKSVIPNQELPSQNLQILKTQLSQTRYKISSRYLKLSERPCLRLSHALSTGGAMAEHEILSALAHLYEAGDGSDGSLAPNPRLAWQFQLLAKSSAAWQWWQVAKSHFFIFFRKNTQTGNNKRVGGTFL